MDKSTVGIKIFKLDVGGLTLLIIFGGLDFQIRASVHCGGVLLVCMVVTHFWGLFLCSRMHKMGP